MKNMKIATVIALILMMVVPMIRVGADVDIDITTSGSDVDLDITTGNGTLLTIDYEGRDLIGEIAEKIKTIADLRQVIIALAMRNDIAEVESQLAALEETLQKLIDELGLVLNDLYYKLSTQAHVIGINPGNNTVAITLISGNVTIADYLDDILIDLNATDRELTAIQEELASIQEQFYTIYDGMLVHDTLIMNSRSTIRGVNTTLNTRIAELAESFNEALVSVWATDMALKEEIDLQGMDIEELRHEVSQVYEELMRERANRNNMTIMFVIFSVLCIGIVAYSRKG